MNSQASTSVVSSDALIWVICLCAQWCGVCRDYRGVVEGMAQRYPGMRFAWLDIEDQADLVGELDVETFPTLLIAEAQGTRFFGPVPPQPQNLSRLLDSLPRAGLPVKPHDAITRDILLALQLAPEFWVSS